MKRDWEKEVRDYLASGKTQVEFARERGLSTSDLSIRLKRARKAGGFIRVGVPERIELELPGGIVLRVTERDLSSVLKALRA